MSLFLACHLSLLLLLLLCPRTDLRLIKQKANTHIQSRAHMLQLLLSRQLFRTRHPANKPTEERGVCPSTSVRARVAVCLSGLISPPPPGVSGGRLPDINRGRRANICFVFCRNVTQRLSPPQKKEEIKRKFEFETYFKKTVATLVSGQHSHRAVI